MVALPDIETYLTRGGDGEAVPALVNRVSIRPRGKTIQCDGFSKEGILHYEYAMSRYLHHG